jgi:hypothetical protein
MPHREQRIDDEIIEDEQLAGTEGRVGAAHTPGPWKAWTSTPEQVREHFVQSTGLYPPVVICRTGRVDMASADDARLIAAAPDLLAALRETLRVLVTPMGLPEVGKGRTEEQQVAFDAARAAIAKALGE